VHPALPRSKGGFGFAAESRPELPTCSGTDVLFAPLSSTPRDRLPSGAPTERGHGVRLCTFLIPVSLAAGMTKTGI
jgi:hypothetical protein